MKPLFQLIVTILLSSAAFAQPTSQPPAPAGGRGGGRGGIPGATAEQTAAIARVNQTLAELNQKVADSRAKVLKASLTLPLDQPALLAGIQQLKADELALALSRAQLLEKLQATPDALSTGQLTALPAVLSGARGGGGANGGIPGMTSKQMAALMEMTGSVQKPNAATTAARADLLNASLALPSDEARIKALGEALASAELSAATARADALAKIQSSPEKLAPDQLAALIASGGVISSGPFSEPQPIDFNDHLGYVSLFDGVSLKGWDGNPKFWRVEDGAIIGESTPQNPSGNSYIAYRDIEAHDFTLKFEIKVEGTGGSGIQYRSKTGIPWLTAIPANVTANVGPVNLNWMMTGPQADFWPSRVYTGQFYSENTPMRIMAWRGQVVEGAGMAPRRLMANIGDREALGKLVKVNDWNQYTVIARGTTFIHIVNGQLMAVMIDDDPTSSNNWSGQIGIEIEATTKIFVRNIWLRKLN